MKRPARLVCAALALLALGSPLAIARAPHEDATRGTPSFLWAGARGSKTGAELRRINASPELAARHHLAAHANPLDLEPGEIATLPLARLHDTGRGPIIVSFGQRHEGIPVFQEEIRLLMDRGLNLVAISGSITGRGRMARMRGGAAAHPVRHDAVSATALALSDLTGTPHEAAGLRDAGAAPGDHRRIEPRRPAEPGLVSLLEPARARRVWFRLPKDLRPAWYVELNAGSPGTTDSNLYAYVIDAEEGSILFRHDLTVSDQFSYRVWADAAGSLVPDDGPQGTSPTPHPTGLTDGYQAAFVPPALVTLQNGPISTNDPWLPPGATTTSGNNAEAFADIVSPDGFSSGDLFATTTSPGTFDRIYDTSLAASASAAQRMAAITQLFYDVNFLHDWFYDAGFDEASGNAQNDNYGRGGLAFDAMRAEAQDYGGRNNANMSTPSDGGRPRMQMYIFDGIAARDLTIASPAALAGLYAVGTATFGPQSFTTAGLVAAVDDGSTAGTGGTLTDGCQTPFANAVQISGRIALLDRGGGCSFTVKAKNAQLNGAIAVLIANNASGLVNMSGTDATIIIPAFSVSQADGAAIRAQLGSGVSVTLSRATALERDGTIDNQIVAHEWGHYISNRLIGNGTGLSNAQGGGMGEGWGDFHSMLLTVRHEDAASAAGADYNGVYAMAGYVRSGGPNGPAPNQGYYFGIRRYPYSIDFSKNPLTFRHISNGVPLPVGPPVAFGADGLNNAQVHNTGEVWASMLWECYAALLRDTGRLTFEEAQQRMIDYLVAGYKMTPSAPTFLEARDAILSAAFAADPADFDLLAAAFARRGAGVGAIAPDRHSVDNTGVVESYLSGGDIAVVSAILDDDGAWCDRDGLLDDGETATLRVTLRNSGWSALTATTLSVASTHPAVSFPAGPIVPVPSSAPFATVETSIPIRLSGASGAQALDLELTLDDPGLAGAGPASVSIVRRANLDEHPAASATDYVESGLPSWIAQATPPLGPGQGWSRLEVTGLDHRWFSPDPGGAADVTLTSPPLQAGTGALGLTFRHRHAFEFAGAIAYDGGVIEISSNGGASWTDIGSFASPGYTGTIATGGGNPIEGRPAYTGNSPGYPAFTTVALNLGTAWAGQTVRIRFRIGADLGVGAPGWEIDDIAATGVTNLPFPALAAEDGLCLDSDVDGVDDLGDCAPFDPGDWGAPEPAEWLDASGEATTTLLWDPPAAPGSIALQYDLLRSDVPQFGAAICLESGDTDLTAADPSIPGTIHYYLVRARNGGGESLGSDSSGAPRTAPACP